MPWLAALGIELSDFMPTMREHAHYHTLGVVEAAHGIMNQVANMIGMRIYARSEVRDLGRAP